MIRIIVNGRDLELPSDIAFTLTLENRMFSNSDGYSFDIEIPLRDSCVNSEIFGVIWRKDAEIEKLKFSAILIAQNVVMRGIVAIVSVSDKTLSIQFLEGRSAQNFERDLEEKYINELELERFSVPTDVPQHPQDVWKSFDEGAEAVAIPWVNNNSESGIVQNCVKHGDNGGWSWNIQNKGGLSYFPYLPVLIHKICKAVGYRCDIVPLERSRFRHLIICNALPAVFNHKNYADALPHWTVNEFFEKLEPILDGEFDIDNSSKIISFRFTRDILEEIDPVCLDDVVDDFTAEIDTMNDDKSNLDLMHNIGYKDNGSRFWPILSCDWFIRNRRKNPDAGEPWVMPGSSFVVGDDGHRRPADDAQWIQKWVVEFDTMDEFISKFKEYEYFGFHRNPIVQQNLYYVREVDCHFIFHSTDYLELSLKKGFVHHFEIMPVNVFGMYTVDPEEEDFDELSTVPVPIDDAEFKCAFLTFTNPDDSEMTGDEVYNYSGTGEDPWSGSENSGQDAVDFQKSLQPLVYQNIMKGDQLKKQEYFDRLFLGFWAGNHPYLEQIGPRPITSNVVIYDYFKYKIFKQYSLRLNHDFSRGSEQYLSIDDKKLFKFSFISDSLPSPRATYYIKGKRYICSKLTIEFNARGMSRMVKGEFYRF